MQAAGQVAGQRTRWIAARAAIAVALMVGFYVLALGMAGGLLFVPVAEWPFLRRVDLPLALFCLVGAGLILKAIIPRPDRFQAPGPALGAARHPALFAELRAVARAVNQEMPAEVFLIPDVDAWVSLRGGLMGFGSHRVMGLGLPPLRILTISELRGVLTHEFGHYQGGDTRLGPWVYKTREAIARTLQALGKHSPALQKPFDWYGRLFLRITLAVCRHQELQADALAARVAGAGALARALQATHDAAAAFPAYFFGEVLPVLEAGFHPPPRRRLRLLHPPAHGREDGQRDHGDRAADQRNRPRRPPPVPARPPGGPPRPSRSAGG